MSLILEKYLQQFNQTRPQESKSIKSLLKSNSEFRKKTIHDLLYINYASGYDILNEAGNARYIEFQTAVQQKASTDYHLNKVAYTYYITREYDKQNKNILINKRVVNWKTMDVWMNPTFSIDIEKAILNHSFPYNLCQKRIDKHFKKFDTDLSIEDQQNAYLINKTIGFSLRPKSNAYVLDIDSDGTIEGKDKADKTLRKLIEIHSSAILYIERSFSGAYHLVIRFKDQEGIALQTFYDYIDYINETYLNDNSYSKLDITGNGIRCLFSSTYYPINWDSNYPEQLGELYNSLLDTIIDFKYKYEKSLSQTFSFPIKKKTRIRVAEEPVKPKEDLILKNSSIYGTRVNSNNFNKIRITKGNRWNVQKKLIPLLKAKGYTKEQTWEHLLSIDDGCRARSECPDKWQKEVYSFYEKSRAVVGSAHNNSEHSLPDTYRSQKKHLPSHILDQINNEEFIRNVIYYSQYKYSKRNVEIFRIILTEIFGTFYYDTLNPKQLKEGQNPKFLIGSQFSQTACNMLKQKHEILKHVAVYKLIRRILHFSMLFKLYNPFKSGYRSWIYIKNNHEDNKCNQWLLNNNISDVYTIKTINNIVTMLISIYNRTIYKISYNYIYLKKIFKHLYILNLFLSLTPDLEDRIDKLLISNGYGT